MKTARRVVFSVLFFLPKGSRKRLDRRMRGHGELRKLRRADVVVVSCPKSGRTWMRALLSNFYKARHGLKVEGLLGFDNYHKANRAIPRIYFTHDNHIRHVLSPAALDALYREKKIVLIARDPRDVSCSAYFQRQHRMDETKRGYYGDAYADGDVTVFDFLTKSSFGLVKVVDFLNRWRAKAEAGIDVLSVRYEDLRADTGREFAKVLDHLGEAWTPEQLTEAVENSSFKRMQSAEKSGALQDGSSRFGARDGNQQEGLKVRRGKVGGYSDYLSPEELREVDALVVGKLDPSFGYGPSLVGAE